MPWPTPKWGVIAKDAVIYALGVVVGFLIGHFLR